MGENFCSELRPDPQWADPPSMTEQSKLSPLAQLLGQIKEVADTWKADDLQYHQQQPGPGQLTPWFRGVTDATHDCEPSLLRGRSKEFNLIDSDDVNWDDIRQKIKTLERYICNRFQTMAASFVDIDRSDRITWRSILQHHGLPSRLLDWSANRLVAIYFATLKANEKEQKDAKLWMLNPRVLSAAAQRDKTKRHIADPQDDVVGKWFDLTEDLRYSDLPLPIIPRHVIERHTAQHARFTLHAPRPKWWNRLHSDGMDPAILREFPIAKEDLRSIRQELSELGVTPATVFPSLDGIAEELKLRLSWRDCRD